MNFPSLCWHQTRWDFPLGRSRMIPGRLGELSGSGRVSRNPLFHHEPSACQPSRGFGVNGCRERVLSGVDVQQLVDEHFERIHRAALVLCGNPWDAEDLAQETFLLAARKAHCFRGDSAPYTWLYGILLNVERRCRRRHGTWRRKLDALYQWYDPRSQSVPGADLAVHVAEWKEGLWSQVARLPDAQRQTLVLRFSEGLQYEEIAEVLGCPLGTVKSRIHHGLLKLRQLLEADGEAATWNPQLIKDWSYAV
jgi:RNA polymerase sigma-70 factor, ECF subfamily